MANVKELRGRIKSIGNIAKITRAMEMVASMKLRKVQQRTVALHEYTRELNWIAAHLVGALREIDHPLFQTRPVATTAMFLITSDRGLCGSYNANVLATARAFVEATRAEHPERKFRFYVIGKKGLGWFRSRGFDIQRYFDDPTLDKARFIDARVMGEEMLAEFVAGEFDEMKIAWTRFEGAARFKPVVTTFFPVSATETDDSHFAHFGKSGRDDVRADFLIEPDAETLLTRILPRYLETIIYDVMLNSLASELASRRMAMKGATDAATRMGKDLRKIYNRARQESITKELLDIIGGASAVA